MNILITGSSGLIGSEAVEYYSKRGHSVFGIDNNMRKYFFGEKGDTLWNVDRLKNKYNNYSHFDIDIRDFEKVDDIIKTNKFNCIIHCAAQPSHDKAADIPLIDFHVNATGTINLLEATRRHSAETVFIYMSTNKVYGDTPNKIPLIELETRWDYKDKINYNGINEKLTVDQSTHSLFGASKLSGDIIAQEYGRYFNMNVGVFRGGCLTGPMHSGVELHGFLSYLVKVAIAKEKYTVFGYKGKQVRDNIHSLDVIRAFNCFIENPKQGEVYNLGGGRQNSISILEAIKQIEESLNYGVEWSYNSENRVGDHICYISDLSKFQAHYPAWSLSITIDDILSELITFELKKKHN
tara:strand:+ start:135 stop:1187 length:1053 start_codon:yes stop_codon:yes gene_type:complete